jgi:hypothetical protein
MTNRQQRFLVAFGLVFALLLTIIASDNQFATRVSVWGFIILVGLLSFSKENWIRPDKALETSKFARFWLVVSLVVQMALAVQSLRGGLDLSGFISSNPGMLFLVLFLPMYGSVIVSILERFKELG